MSEGAGGGFGKYKGLSISEVKNRFDRCAEEPSMRAISAVLRIAREQLESRGQLGHYPAVAWASFGCAILCGGSSFLLSASLADLARKAAMVFMITAAVLGFGAFRVRRERRDNFAQEKAIRAEAVSALRRILAAEPSLKPLTREQRDLVRELIRKERAPELSVLLEVSPE